MSVNVLKQTSRLPAEYQEVEWIKSNNNAYINPSENITADIGFEVTANIPSETNGCLIGNYLPGSYFFFVYSYTNNTTNFFPEKNANTISMSIARDSKVTFSFKNGVLDDGTTQTTVPTYATYEVGQPIYLFAGRPNNWFVSYTLYECKIYNGSTVVKDLIPCYRKSDEVIGLYDIVNNVFYTNANSVGYFEKGNDVFEVEKVKVNLIVNGTRLPSEYQEVEYIAGNGNQYIDTGIKLTSEDVINCKFELTSTPTSYAEGVYGTMEQINSTNTFFVLLMRTPSLARVGSSSNQVTSTNVATNTIYDTTLSNGTYIENGTTYTFTPHNGFTFETNCYVFKRNQSAMTPINGKIYSFEIVGKFNGIPCYRKSDNAIGLYDTVSETFFTNAGTGTFLKGNNVSTTAIQPVKINILKKLLPDAYQQVEYIESTGTQWIDTGMKQSNLINCDITAQYEISSGALFGSSNEGSGYMSKLAITPNNFFSLIYRTSTITPTLSDTFKSYISVGNSNNTCNFDIYKDDVLIQSDIDAAYCFIKGNDDLNLYLFKARKIWWSETANTIAKLAYFKTYDRAQSQTICEMIPCYRKADNEIGLYNLVNDVFYTNAGTGTFEKGNDVNQYVIIKI